MKNAFSLFGYEINGARIVSLSIFFFFFFSIKLNVRKKFAFSDDDESIILEDCKNFEVSSA